MAMSYRSVFINENSFVICLCVLLAIFGRFSGAEDVSNELTTTTRLPMLTSGQSCANWTAQPEAADGNCTRLTRHGVIRCYGGMNNLGTLTSRKDALLPAKEMLLCGWPQKVFDPLSELQKFTQLRSLTMEYSSFTEFVFDFPEMFYLQAINISWTNLSHISARTFKQIHSLRILDLRWNQLIQLDGPLILPRSFHQLYLAGNPWNCTRNFKWLLLQPEKGRLVADREQLICTDRQYNNRQMLQVMHYEVVLRRECESHADLRNCTCRMHHIISNLYIPLYTVNCSHLQFRTLPPYLPENTTALYMNDNLISDLNPLRENPFYRNVVDMQLENNRISNIDILEDSYWLQNFRLLSLRGNLFRKLQVYALDNALKHNAGRLMLSRNPWHCTCKFGPRLRELLNRYKDIVEDAWNVTCTYMKGDELHQAKVLSLTLQDMCNVSANDDRFIHPIDWLNAVLASLIVALFMKLGYDYYFYRYHGRIPWIVLKMP